MPTDVIEMDEVMPGWHIDNACDKAISLANEKQARVRFVFNDTEVIAHPGDVSADLRVKWSADMEAASKAYRESPEYKARRAKEEEDEKRARSAPMKESAKTEQAMAKTDAPTPRTKDQLLEYITSLVDRQHDYGTCVYAMSLAATAAFNFVSHQLGVTGFQASCADLDFVRRSRHIDGPFILVTAHDALYPQSDPREKLDEALAKWKPWLKEQATKNLKTTAHAHENVLAHWDRLANS